MKLKLIGIFLILFAFVQSIPHQLHPRTQRLYRKTHVKPLTSERGYRLPKDTIPISYDVKLVTHLEDPNDAIRFTFDGTVEIKIHVVSTTKDIVMHKRKELIISKPIVTCDGSNIFIQSNENPNEFDFLRITNSLANFAAGSNCTIFINFAGILRSDNLGFYLSSYNNNGTIAYIASTQFENVEARSTFPCYDEPGIRAKFKIQITHGRDYTAISNMPVVQRIEGSTTVVTEFQETPPVQTYLIAFAVTNFKSISTNDYAKIPQRVFAKPQSVNAGEADVALRYVGKLVLY